MATAAKAATEPTKRPKQGRSPAYPGINLEEAIAKAKALHEAEGKYSVPMSSAFMAWGYGAKSSGGRETRAALRYFGLIVVEGHGAARKIKLTDKALRILQDDREDQSEKRALIRELALWPAIHKQIYTQFPQGIKSEATVEYFLIHDKGYNQSAASEIVNEFKATAAYAGLFEPDSMVVIPEGVSGEEDDDSEDDQPPPPPPEGHKGTQVKVMAGERVVFTEENNPQQYLKLVASGEVDDSLLEALEDYVKRQRKRLQKGEAAN